MQRWVLHRFPTPPVGPTCDTRVHTSTHHAKNYMWWCWLCSVPPSGGLLARPCSGGPCANGGCTAIHRGCHLDRHQWCSRSHPRRTHL